MVRISDSEHVKVYYLEVQIVNENQVNGVSKELDKMDKNQTELNEV